MSESKKLSRRQSLWALSLPRSDDPLLLALERYVETNKSYYINAKGFFVKMRVIRDLSVIGLRVVFSQKNDVEGLRLIAEHEMRERTREALLTGASLPTVTPQPQPSPIQQQPAQQTSIPQPPGTPLAIIPPTQPIAQTPTQPQPTSGLKRKTISGYSISSSGHGKIEEETK